MNSKQNIPGYWTRFLLRLKHWEFWPTTLVYLPVILCYPYWALRSGSLFFFALVNPNMKMGGLYGGSKYDALMELDKEDIPTTLLFAPSDTVGLVMETMKDMKLDFPIIVKPDLGERGKGVEKVSNLAHLEQIVAAVTSPFIVQEYIDLPFEAGVFYIRKPSEDKGMVTSVVVKGFLSIVGDGEQTIEQLAAKDKRAVLIWDSLMQCVKEHRNKILAKGQKLTLEPIGNHRRGTAFNDGRHLMTDALIAETERMAQSLPNFYYGRFDVRAESEEAFRNGKTMRVMEVNGANAEPAHIYQEGTPLLEGLTTLVKYWNMLYLIAKENKKNHALPKFSEAWVVYRDWQNIKKEKLNAPMGDVSAKFI